MAHSDPGALQGQGLGKQDALGARSANPELGNPAAFVPLRVTISSASAGGGVPPPRERLQALGLSEEHP